MAAKSGTGLKKETAAALASLFGPTIIIPVVLFLLEKDSFVRFYATQAIVSFIAAILLAQVFFVTIFLALLSRLVWIGWFIIWLAMTYKAWQGEKWELPVLGKISRQILSKLK